MASLFGLAPKTSTVAAPPLRVADISATSYLPPHVRVGQGGTVFFVLGRFRVNFRGEENPKGRQANLKIPKIFALTLRAATLLWEVCAAELEMLLCHSVVFAHWLFAPVIGSYRSWVGAPPCFIILGRRGGKDASENAVAK